MKVRDLMLPDPPTVDERDYVYQVFKKINEKGIGRVLVLKDGNVAGIISTRDLIELTYERCSHTCEKSDVYGMLYRTAKDVMTPQPQVAYEDMDPLDALTIMVSRNFGALPVLDSAGRLKGIITEREMLLLFQDLEELFPVKRFMTKGVRTAYKEATLKDAIQMIAMRGFRRVPVTDEVGKIIGIVTASDIVRGLSKEITKGDPEEFLKKRLEEVMTKNVLTVSPDDSVNRAAAKMVIERVGSLIIPAPDGRAQGIITERDLVIALYHQLHLTLR